MTTHFLTIEDGRLVDYVDHSDVPTVVTAAALDALMDVDADILCSSSIDNPAEYTTDPAVLQLVARLAR